MTALWRKHIINLVSLALVAACSFGCGEKGGKSSGPPTDTGTEVQHEILDKVISEIQAGFDELDVDIDLKKLPIIIAKSKKHRAYCETNGKGHSKFIVIDPSVIPKEADSNSVYAGGYPGVFWIVLHEIGHCYFDRHHDDKLLETKDTHVAWYERKAEDRYEITYDSLPTSVMNDDLYIAAPKSLQEYYLAELAGLRRAKSLESLARKTSGITRRRIKIDDDTDTKKAEPKTTKAELKDAELKDKEPEVRRSYNPR